jgi:hypothetical protein
MQDRPVLGGNASSECRMHICGADVHNHHKNLRETGILEEIRLENLARNPNKNYSIWDTILYEKAKTEPNLTLLMNCTCQSAQLSHPPAEEGPGVGLISSITGWQLTTQTYHTVHAKIFADCSGDAILAPLTGAEFRMGREARHEYGESIAPEIADERTMGMTCLFQAREYATPQPFAALPWANVYENCADLPYGEGGHRWQQMGYWWLELGGEAHSIYDTEALRDELLKVVYGVWDHLKNRCAHKEDVANWAIEWIQFLPAKRESRRYVGEHVLTQNDVRAEGRFDDLVAYGGWSMDDHHPAGFNAVKIGAPATIFHPAPAPYGIPYRALYSRNIANLMFAGRDASCTHAAMSSTRVMGTGISMGQAVGTAAALAVQKSLLPAGVKAHMHELQQTLLADDAYLPWAAQQFSALTTAAELTASQGNPAPVCDGINRPVGADLHAWVHHPGDWIAYRFPASQVESVTLILDSALERNIALSHHQPDDQLTAPPPCLQKSFRIEGLVAGVWQTVAEIKGNHQRLVHIPIGRQLEGVRCLFRETWGEEESKLFAFYLE